MQPPTSSDSKINSHTGNNLLTQHLFQVLPAAVYTCDANGYIQQYNQAAAELWGMAPVLGQGRCCESWKIVTPDGLPLTLEQCPLISALKQGIEIKDEEIIIERPNGERRIVIPHQQPFFDDAGNVAGAINMLVDVTEKKEAEKNNAWLTALIQSSEDAIISKTLNGVITSWNTAAERLFGYTAQEMIGQHITLLIPPDRIDEETHIINRITRGESVQHFDTLRLTKDKRLIDISLTISPIRNKKGEIIGASKIARDITRSKQAEEQLRHNEKYLNELANAVPQLVWTTQANGAVDYFNDRIYEYKGIEKTPDGAWQWEGVVHPDDLAVTAQEWSMAISNGTEFVREHRLQMAGSTYRWHLSRIIPYKDEHGKISKWIGTATDIDDMKQMALRKDDFLSVVSHELRTPITSIKAYSQLLANRYRGSGDDFLKNALGKLEVQANKMSNLVTDFLKLSKIEAGKMQLVKEKFFIHDLVFEIAGDLQLVSVNHTITVEVCDEVEVLADRERISQVLANFINNAVKYSPGAAQIVVTCKTGKDSAGKDNVTVSVTDKGVGIKPEEHHKIFERFYRAQSNGNIPFSGFGIGLYISAEIIQRHEGQIGVQSQEGQGSTFYFSIPQA